MLPGGAWTTRRDTPAKNRKLAIWKLSGFFLVADGQFDKLYFRHGVLDNLKRIASYLYDFIELGEALIIVEDESAEGHVIVTFREFEVELLIDFVDFQTGRKQIGRAHV